MSRSRSFFRLLVAAAALFTVLLVVAPAFAETTPAPASPQAKAEAVRTALQGIDGHLDRLEADITRAEHLSASPPGIFSRELQQLRWQVKDQTHDLIGLHWTIANPVLVDAVRIRGRIKDLEGRLKSWQPKLPPDPNRPLKTSAATGTGAITGTLTDEASGDPIPYTRVEVYCPSPYFDAETMTGADGAYTMSGLGTGDCYVRTWNQLSYIDELYDDIPCTDYCYMGDGTPIPVIDGQTTTGIDFALQLGGEIRGTLTSAEDGSPLTNIYVDAFDATGSQVDSTTTDSDGRYRFTALPAGSYFVKTDTSTYAYVNELYDDIQCIDYCDPTTGTPITVTTGQITTGIDFALEPVGMITGTITDSQTGEPLENAYLALYSQSGSQIGSSYTDSDGTYSVLGVPPGSNFLIAGQDAYVAELYDNIPCLGDCDPTTGTPIQVDPGATTPGIDFSLDPAPSISGTVVDSVSGAPLETASVSLYNQTGNLVANRYCDPLGMFDFAVAEPGTYYVLASEDTHVTELYQEISCPFDCDPTSGTPINLSLGTHVTGADFTLDPQAKIIGTVTSDVGDPLQYTPVLLYDPSGSQVASTQSDSLGQFEFRKLPPGTFFSMAHPIYYPLYWVDQLYDGIDCPDACDPTSGTPITTPIGGVVQIGFSLTPFGRISGHVTDATSGDPIPRAMVTLYDSNGNWLKFNYAAEDGSYEFWGLPDGDYYFVASDSAHYAELYDNIRCENGCDVTAGTPVSATIGSVTAGIDFALDRMGSISGHLTDALTGNGIYATLTAYDSQGVQVATTPYFYGTYSVDGLEPGIYYLKASAFLTYVDELYDNIPCNDGCDVTTGTPVIVTDGADTPNIDFVLEPVQIFDDVPLGYWARYWIQELYWAGITSGCATDPLRYCPQTPELRNQMAVFLLRSKERSSYTPPPAVGAFDDVPIDDPFAPWIEELAARGITAGCSADPPLYCPNAPVTRRQMAKFLLSTLEGPLYQPPAAVGVFDDVPVGDPFAPWIEDLAARGITAGCSANPPLFCPNNPVSRAEMAVFLVKTFNLQ